LGSGWLGRALDAVDDAISVIDHKGVYRFVNEAWCRRIGLSSTQVVGRRVQQMPSSRSIPEHRASLAECLAGLRKLTERVPWQSAEGQACELRIDYHPYEDAANGSRCAIVVCRDVTLEERQLAALQQSDAERRAILDAFPGYIAAIQQDVRYSYVNAATAARLGSTPDKIIGQHARDVLGPEKFLKMMGTWWDRLRAGEKVVTEISYPGEHGLPSIRLQVTRVAGPRRVDGGQTFYAFGIDVSDYLRARRDLDLMISRLSQSHGEG
jgi:PAS domain S-box-containing protein